MSLRAALFDFDGTLVDSDPAHLAAFNELLAPHGRQMSQLQYDREVAGRSNGEIMSKLFPEADAATVIALGEAKEAAYLRRPDLVATRDGATAVLRQLKDKGIRIALVTNAPRQVITDLIARFGLLPYFDATVTVDDVTNGKPHPEPYLQALSKLGLDATQAVAIEDSETGRRSADAAGLPVLLLKPESAIHVAEEREASSLVIASLYGVLDHFGLGRS